MMGELTCYSASDPGTDVDAYPNLYQIHKVQIGRAEKEVKRAEKEMDRAEKEVENRVIYFLQNFLKLDVLVIGIFGGTCSGKSTIADIIEKTFDDVVHISQDWFYKASGCNGNYDHPQSIKWDDLVQCVLDLIGNKETLAPIYSFVHHKPTGEFRTIKPKKVVVIDGILLMTCKKLRDLCNLKIGVKANLDTMLRRRKERDTGPERGRTEESILAQWNSTVKPMHLEFVEPSFGHADILINNDNHQAEDAPQKIPQIACIVTLIMSYIQNHKNRHR